VQLNRQQLISAYRGMKTIREFEERLHVERPRGIIPGNVHLYAGQEAVAIGTCVNLGPKDYVASTHRGHGHCIAKACDVKRMMLEIYGRQGGLCNGKGGSMHIADLDQGMLGANGIVGANPPIACGAALSAKVLKTGGVAVAFIGDGATNEGATNEALNLASVWKLPVIFLVEDNGYAQATASRWSVGGDLIKRAEGFGIRGVRTDGSDFFAVHETMRECIERAREGSEPSLVHARTERFYGHFEGDAMGYRAPGEVEKLRATKDPLVGFRRRVTEAHLLTGEDLDGVDREVLALIDAAVADAEAAPPVPLEMLTTDVYVSY
jgi:pyruvate dehydrogenase E1 component alpha subunit